MYAFSGGALLQDVANARREMDSSNDKMAKYHRKMMAEQARKKEKANLRHALNGKKQSLAKSAKGSLSRLSKGHSQDSAMKADEELLASTFKKFDTDGSGTIDVSELGEALKMVLGKRPCRETVKQLFSIADTDGNGVLDFDEWMVLARQGEMVNRQLLNPKYRFLMKARHERAAERDASAAALAAKAAQIEEKGREIAVLRQEWEAVEEQRRRDNAETRRQQEREKASIIANRDRSGAHQKAMDAKRRAATLKTYQQMVHYQQNLLKEKRKQAMQGTLLDMCRTTERLVDEDGVRKRATGKLGLTQQRFYVGSAHDRHRMAENHRRSSVTGNPFVRPVSSRVGSPSGGSIFNFNSAAGASGASTFDPNASAVYTAASPERDPRPRHPDLPSQLYELNSLSQAEPFSPGFNPNASVTFDPSVFASGSAASPDRNHLASTSLMSPNLNTTSNLFGPGADLASGSVLSRPTAAPGAES